MDLIIFNFESTGKVILKQRKSYINRAYCFYYGHQVNSKVLTGDVTDQASWIKKVHARCL